MLNFIGKRGREGEVEGGGGKSGFLLLNSEVLIVNIAHPLI